MRRSPLPINSNMYWISPSDEGTNMNMLRYLTAGGLQQVLQQVSTVIDDNCNHLTLYQMTFIIIHSCPDFHFHTDFNPSLSGQAYTVLFPLQLVESSPPEVVIQREVTNTVHSFKYERGHAFLWGPNTVHATAIVSYPKGAFRICVSLSLGCITPLTVQLIARDISQQYPPKREKFLLELASKAHWTRNSGIQQCHLPCIDEYIIYGKEWLNQFHEWIELQKTNTSILMYPKNLRKWMTQQRYAYAVKHGKNNSNANTLSCVKTVKTLTDSRKQKLKDNNFIFSLGRDEGRNQERWEIMFERAMRYKEEHRTLTVSTYVDQQLHSWLVIQRKKLLDDSKLSIMGKVRKNKLLQLGLNFK